MMKTQTKQNLNHWTRYSITLLTSVLAIGINPSLGLAIPQNAPLQVQTNLLQTKLPEAGQISNPDGGGPGNRSSAGRRTGCNYAKKSMPAMPGTQVNQEFYALVPLSGKIHSLDAQPTLWFYIPDDSEIAPLSARFTLHSPNNSNSPDYSTTIAIAQSPGIIGVRLPQPLKPGVAYHWFFTIVCDSGVDGASVDGWIQHTPLSTDITAQVNNPSLSLKQRLQFYQQHHLWHDRVTLLATQLNRNPEAKQEWQHLLQEGNLENLRQEPVQGVYSLR